MMIVSVWLLLLHGSVVCGTGGGSGSVVVMQQASLPANTTRAQPTCPKHCTCSSHWREINCEHQHLTAIPPDIPVNATTLLLGYNSLTSLLPNTFIDVPNLTTLSLKNNILVDIHAGAFAGLSKLRFLYLTANKLAVLHMDVWVGLGSLQKLYLSQNQLTKVPDVSNCTSLTDLGLANNMISDASIPSSFNALRNFSRLTLNTNPITQLTAKGFDALRNISVTGLELSVLQQLSQVENGTFRGLRNLRSLSLSYNPRLSLSGLQNILNSLGSSPLTSIDISSSIQTETQIPVSLFQGLQSAPLKTLFMKHHKLTFIRNGTFLYLSQLNILDLSEGNLVKIDDDTLSALVSLKKLLINKNSLASIPQGLPASLVIADLSYNAFTQITPQTFIMNSNLQNLTLAYCQIVAIYKEAFLGLGNLRYLNLSHNHISNNNIAINTFESTIKLAVLDLSYNQIMFIGTERDLFMYATELSLLDMSHNSLSNFSPHLFSRLTKLQELRLAGNTLFKMIAMDESGVMFGNLTHLVTLDLSHSGIGVLPAAIFHGLSSLRHLNLCGNVIRAWTGNVFLSVPFLVHLDMSKNHIAVVNKSALSVLHTFGANLSLDLSSNPFDCYCDLIWFRRWMNATNVTLQHEQQYVCAAPTNMIGTKVLNFNPADIRYKCIPYWWYIIGGAVVILLVIFPIIILVYRKYYWIRIKLYRLRKGRRHAQYDTLREHVKYLGVISYAEEDQQWVVDKIAGHLTSNGIDKKLLFHQAQNCHYGQGCISFLSELIESTAESFRTVIVVSLSYLQDRLSQCELDGIIHELIENSKREPVEQAQLDKVVLILREAKDGEEIQIRDKLPRALGGVVQNSAQCLVWKAADTDAQTLCSEKLLDTLRCGMEHVVACEDTGDSDNRGEGRVYVTDTNHRTVNA